MTGAIIPNILVGRPSAPPQIPSPTIDTSDWGDTIGSLIGTGLSAWQSKMQTDLLQSQINHNQTPTIVAGPNGVPSAGYSYSVGPNGAVTYSAGGTTAAALAGASGSILSSGLIWIVLIVLAVVLLARR